MQILTLDLEDDYALIGIHSTEEDYRLAFLINKNLNTKFIRHKHSLDFKNSSAKFPVFEYKDKHNFINYFLINNKHIQNEANDLNNGLFEGEYSTTSYLLPEKKRIDYFLKIEGSNLLFINDLVEKLNRIKQIITSFSLDTNSIKSKNNLIF